MTRDIAERAALVTGASSGIGKAIATAIHGAGARVILVGRSLARLDDVAADLDDGSGRLRCRQVDLAEYASIAEFSAAVADDEPGLDILVNCAGMYGRGTWDDTTVESLEQLMSTNVLGPFALTKGLLPTLIRNRGDVVFINSSVVRHSAAGAGQFAATQHALVALADALRAEVNAAGVRVVSVYPGRTATPRQQKIHQAEGRDYTPDRLLQAADVARAVLAGITAPETAEITDLHIRQRFK